MAGSTPAKPGEKAREQRAEEVKDIQLENRERSVTNVPEEPTAEVTGTSVSGRKDKPILLEVAAGELIVTIGREAVRLDKAAVARFSKRLARSAQAL